MKEKARPTAGLFLLSYSWKLQFFLRWKKTIRAIKFCDDSATLLRDDLQRKGGGTNLPILRHKPGAPQRGGNLGWLKTSSNSADAPHGEMMDALLISKARSARRQLTFGHHFTVSPSIAGNPSNDCWNGVRDFDISLLTAVSMQAGEYRTWTVEMARGHAATHLVRVKEEHCHVHH